MADFTIGDTISVIGVLNSVDNKVRIQPRDKNDIANIISETDLKNFSDSSNLVSSTTIPNTIDTAPVGSRKNMLAIYIMSAVIIIMGISGYFIFKKK